MKVVVLMGGHSAEREISLRTGHGIAQALRDLGHDVASLDTANGRLLMAGQEERDQLSTTAATGGPLIRSIGAVANTEAINTAEVIFLALHGGAGEDGTIQALLELTGKPYTGSGVLASALAMNKAMSKRLFEREGIPTPAWQIVLRGQAASDLDVAALGGFPLVIKPNEQGSTVGLTIVEREDQLDAALRLAFEFGPEVLAERYIAGRELTVALLGDEALPIVEIRPKSGHYDYEAKYTSGMSEYQCPAELPEPLAERIRKLGRRAARALECRGVCRVDFRLSPENEPFCLEVNTIPGMTPTSLVPMAAKARGLSYDQLVGRMVELAQHEWHRRRTTGQGAERTRA